MPDQPPSPESLLQHGDFVRMLARSLVRDPARADDLAQDTWVAALEKPPRHDGNVKGWLARVMRNLAAMGRRGDWRRVERERRRARPESVAPVADVIARLDWERRIVEGVQALEEPYRSTIVFRFFEHLEPAAIAKRMGVPRKTVYTRLERALAKLRSRFDEQTGGDRRAWCLALLPLAVDPRPVVAGVAVGAAGVTLLASKVGVAIAAGVAGVSFAAGWVARPEPAPPPVPRTVAERAVTPRAGPAEAPAAVQPLPTATESEERDFSVDAYVRELAGLPESYYRIMPFAHRVAALPRDRCRAVTRALFERSPSEMKLRQVLKAFAPSHGNFHPHALEVLDLAARHRLPEVRAAAFYFLQEFGFRAFGSDPGSYPTWRARWRDAPVGEVIRSNLLEFVDRVRGATPERGAGMLREYGDRPLLGAWGCLDILELPRLVKEAGLLDLVTAWLAHPALGAEERRIAHGWIREMRPDDAYLRRHYLPALTTEPTVSPLFEEAARAFAVRSAPWAVDALLATLPRARTPSQLEALVAALGKTGDARAVPALIALVDGERRAMVENLALQPLTGVQPDPAHDGAWWRAWWDRNRHFMPPEARHIPIPD